MKTGQIRPHLQPFFQLEAWYALSMITRLVITPDDWEYFRTDHSDLPEPRYCLREAPAEFLRVDVDSFRRLL